MAEPLPVDPMVEKQPRRFAGRRFLKGAGIGLLVLAILGVILRGFLWWQLDPAASVDVLPAAMLDCFARLSDDYYLSESLFVLFIWWMHAGLVQPLLFPTLIHPLIPYLGAMVIFALLGGGIASSEKSRGTWITISASLLIGYFFIMVWTFLGSLMVVCS